MFLSNTRWTQLSAPLEILMSKISLKYIPIHIHNAEHSRGIINMKLYSHGFLFHRNIIRSENKARIPLIIHHNEKNHRIYFWCAAKDNLASLISRGVTRHLSIETISFKSSMIKYVGKQSLLFNWKTQHAKNVGAFWNELILYEIKLIF